MAHSSFSSRPSRLRGVGRLAAFGLAAAWLVAGVAGAVEVQDLRGLEDLFGRYAPGGDCKRQPRIAVEVTGLTFEVDGRIEKVTNPEYAASYGGNAYEGIGKWIFPFRNASGFPILLAFNAGEKPGVLTIEGHDEGWKGGPKLGAREQRLVDGSPYGRCE